VVWVLKQPTKQVAVFAPGQPVKVLGSDGVLDGGALLRGFTLRLADIFVK